jgi:hypothetical protein
MIELTEQQVLALDSAGPAPKQVMNPLTRETFVLIPVQEYDRLKAVDYDDSPLTPEERAAVAWQFASRENWPEFDDPVDQP